MLVNPLGNSMLVSPLHPSKAAPPMLVSPLGKFMLVSPLHLLKANSPMLVTPLGKFMLVSPLHPLKAFISILVTPLVPLKSISIAKVFALMALFIAFKVEPVISPVTTTVPLSVIAAIFEATLSAVQLDKSKYHFAYRVTLFVIKVFAKSNAVFISVLPPSADKNHPTKSYGNLSEFLAVALLPYSTVWLTTSLPPFESKVTVKVLISHFAYNTTSVVIVLTPKSNAVLARELPPSLEVNQPLKLYPVFVSAAGSPTFPPCFTFWLVTVPAPFVSKETIYLFRAYLICTTVLPSKAIVA